MRIAVIDSGIDPTHPRLKDCKISGISIIARNKTYVLGDDFNDSLGHGTGVAAIIHRIAPYAELIALKVFHDNLVSSLGIIIRALEWCYNNNIHIINMSLGIFTNVPPTQLKDACQYAYKKNIIIVAAGGENHNTECYPAYYPEVFGVCSGDIKDGRQFGRLNNSSVEFLARGNMQRIASKNGGYIFADGSSYACAYMTGIIADYCNAHQKIISNSLLKDKLLKTADQAFKELRPISKKEESPLIVRHELDDIGNKLFDDCLIKSSMGRLALFPISEKEMNSLKTFNELHSYNITKYLDYPKTIKKDRMSSDTQDWMISERDLDTFDTLVIGYFHEHPFQGNVRYGFEMIRKAISKNKNLYFFDIALKRRVEEHYINENYRGKVFCPIVDWRAFNMVQSFRHQAIKTPILALIGTSSKQGKFTAQLRIRQILTNAGHNISHISTEPQGEFLGAAYCFPMGYNPTVQIPQTKWPMFLRSLVRGIEYKLKPDLILSGIQSWTIPVAFNNDSENVFRSLFYLLGIDPDAIVCAINPNDPIERISRNISALRMVSEAKVLFYTISPFEVNYEKNTKGMLVSNRRKLTKKEVKERIDFFEKRLDARVIDILDPINKSFILNEIYNFF